MAFSRFFKGLFGSSEGPLGVRHDLVLTQAQTEALRKIERFDLSLVRRRLISEKSVPTDTLDEAISEFRRYMGIYVVDGLETSVSMFSKHVDQVWHALILHTRMYEEFCNQAFGRMLHHNPFEDGDPDSIRSWAHFEARYRKIYGFLPYIWASGKPYIPPPTSIAKPTGAKSFTSTRDSRSSDSGSSDAGIAASFAASCGGHASCGGSSCGGSSCGGGGCSGS